MCELDYKEGWVLKNWCFRTLVLEKTYESPLDSKEVKLVNPKGNQPWIFIGRTDAEMPILWPPDVKSRLTGKDPDAGKDWRHEKGMIESEMVGWCHWLNGHEFEQTPGDSEGQGIVACCSPLGHRVRHNWVTEQQQKPRNVYWVIVSVQRRTAYRWVVREDLVGLVYALACFTYFVGKDAKVRIENTMF